jgi:uncharacterized protein
MPTLSDKLKSLGVKVGAFDFLPTSKNKLYEITELIPGHFSENYFGKYYLVENVFPENFSHGYIRLHPSLFSLDLFSDWLNQTKLSDISNTEVAFLDLESTGLSGGTGTMAFLVGVGKYSDEGFQIAQFFLQEPDQELAMLIAVEQFISSCQVLVTFNGKSFDIPLLTTRYRLNDWRNPFHSLIQIDLLHLARRLWRDRLTNRSLINLEAQIINFKRAEDDIPGWMIPQIYFDYLRDKDPSLLIKVFYHNAMDVLSMAALLTHSSIMISDPYNHNSLPPVDILSMAKFQEDLGHIDTAVELFLHGLNNFELLTDPSTTLAQLDAIIRLARIYKRKSEYQPAIQLWKKAAQMKSITACVELAKAYEHIEKDFYEALLWTKTGLDLLQEEKISSYDQQNWENELNYRIARIERKIATTRKG